MRLGRESTEMALTGNQYVHDFEPGVEVNTLETWRLWPTPEN